jgi:predicted phosphoribosyltransferase
MFGILGRNFRLKLKDRAAAGIILGEILKGELKKEPYDVVVLGIPRGGVITAGIAFEKLVSSNSWLSSSNNVYFDIVIPRKLTDPDNKEHAIGAIVEDGTYYLDDELISFLQITPQYLEDEKAFQLAEIKRRSMMYSLHLPTYKNSNKAFEDRLVILVDDGAATGSTLITVTRWLRKKRPNRLIIAIPVASKDTVRRLEQESDSVYTITAPSSFMSVEQFYHDFQQIPDEKVIEFVRSRNLRFT